MREIVADIDSQRQQNSNSPSKQGTKIGKNCRKIHSHSSEKRGLRSTFLSSEMLQNLPYYRLR